MSFDLPPGEVIPGTRYRILHHVADGAMGTVYAAEHVDLEKRVALKTLLPDLATSADAVERFRKEARAASKIGSAFICDVTDFGQLPNGQVFFVMEYLDGRSLADLLDAEGALPAARTIAILRQVCKALGAGHEKGIVHLDVKPDNVMLVADGRRTDGVKVVDFGVAGLAAEAKSEERIAGTPEYIAPERALGRGYDHRSDVYSLGVMAYEMLTGTVPFEGPELVEVLKRHVSERPEPPSRRAPDKNVPPALEAVVLQMMAKEPAQRPQRMEVVEAMLCEAQIALGLRTDWDHLDLPPVDEAWQKKLTERMPSPRGRDRRGLVMGALGLAVVAAGLALYFGVIRGPQIKIVRVAVTETEEAEPVAALLERADRAARAGRYVRPFDESALAFIARAEAESEAQRRPSKGAERLRRAYASALTVTGNELAKAGLRELATKKYEEALAFLPGDLELQKAAELTAEERRQLADPKRSTASAAVRMKRNDEAADQAADLAAALFLSAKQGRHSEARMAARQLAGAPGGGAVKARLADALRGLAETAWTDEKRDEARALYQLVLELDPDDLAAKARLAPDAPTVPAVAALVPPPPPMVEDESERGRARRSKRGAGASPEPPGADTPDPESPRDEAAAAQAVADGVRALRAGQLAQAEAFFNQAVRADPQTAGAVGGLAAVAFERAQYSEALDLARRAARLAPKAPEHQIVLGDAYFKLLRYNDALAAYEKAEALAGRRSTELTARIERVKTRLAQ